MLEQVLELVVGQVQGYMVAMVGVGVIELM